MEKITKKMTYEQIENFSIRADFYYQSTTGETKLKAFVKKAVANISPILKSHNEKLSDLRIDNALEDEKGAIMTDEKGNYKFSKEGLKKLNKEVRELYQVEYEFTPYEIPEYIKNYDNNLDDSLLELFEQFITSKN